MQNVLGKCQREKGQKDEVLFSIAVMDDAEAAEQTKTQRGTKRESVIELLCNKCTALNQPLQSCWIPDVIFLSERALSFDNLGSDILMCRGSLGLCTRGRRQAHNRAESKCRYICQGVSLWCYGLAYMEDVSRGKWSYLEKVLLIGILGFLSSG